MELHHAPINHTGAHEEPVSCGDLRRSTISGLTEGVTIPTW